LTWSIRWLAAAVLLLSPCVLYKFCCAAPLLDRAKKDDSIETELADAA
jgi:hypothetical protein